VEGGDLIVSEHAAAARATSLAHVIGVRKEEERAEAGEEDVLLGELSHVRGNI
jgi:hypothetical protein